MEATTFTSPALVGNFRDMPPTRRARVYLPPGYANADRRYAVLYYLHGGFGDVGRFVFYSGKTSADALIASGEMEPMIVVCVDASGGVADLSCYENSELNGNFRDYIVQDLVNHIDTTYRTIAHRNSRGVFGASAGGSATLRYAMQHSDVYGAAYSISTGFFAPIQPEGFFNYSGDVALFPYYPNAGADLLLVGSESDLTTTQRKMVFGTAAITSPNTNNPSRLFVDLPFDLPSLEILPTVREKYVEMDEFTVVDRHWENLLNMRAVAFDMGTLETYGLTFSRRLHQRLDELEVPHLYTEFYGNHTNKRHERIAEAMKFLSSALITEEPAFVSAPRLTPGGILLEWNEAASGFSLQKAQSLLDPTWQDIPVLEDQTNAVVGTEDDQAVFRLVAP